MVKRSRTRHSFSPVSVRLLGVGLGLVAPVAAQVYGNGSNGAFAPTANVTLDTTANGGVFQFTSVNVPAGVTVHLVGTNAARLLSQGAVTIAGRIEADGLGVDLPALQSGFRGGPGGYDGGQANTGYGENGFGPGGGGGAVCLYPLCIGGTASHATLGAVSGLAPQSPVYGAALPFDVRGGSGGGGGGSLGLNPGTTGAGGGGTIVILADGPIVIGGTVSVRGGDVIVPQTVGGTNPQPGGSGSGGSILIRSLGCVQITGTVDARGGEVRVMTALTTYVYPAGHGFIRIDSYTACGAPDLTGATILPAPFVAPMPFLTALEPARIGQTYRARCASAPGDVLGFYYSLGTQLTPVPPFGVLELDPALILFYGLHVVPTTGHDPLASIDIPVPSVPSLIGLSFYSQVFNAFGTVTSGARLSNRLTTTIGS